MPHQARNAAIAILVGLVAGGLITAFIGGPAFGIGFGAAIGIVAWLALSRSR